MTELDLTGLEWEPSLYEVNKFLGNIVVGEESVRLGLFVSWVLSNGYVMLSGSSRTGKTRIIKAVKTLCPQVEVMHGGSKTSAFYDVERINKASHVVIWELNALPDGFIEILKQWGEKVVAEYRATDITSHQRGGNSVRVMKLPYKPFVFAIATENDKKVPKIMNQGTGQYR